MKVLQTPNADIHYRDNGNPDGLPVVFANSLGTDLRLWDDMVAHLPADLRLIRFDKRGHGLSSCPQAPYSMGALIADTEALLDHLEVKNCIFVGISIGGMIAQGLAVKRPDLVRGMVLSNTAAKIGTHETWQARIDAVQSGGLDSIADQVMSVWFSKTFRETSALIAWRNLLTRIPVDGYIGCCAAIAGTDFFTTTAGLRLPTLVIAGSEDGSTPPDLVRETAELIEGADFQIMRGVGHLPCVEKPEAYAALLMSFIDGLGHD